MAARANRFAGQTHTVSSNTVTLRVVQPVKVRTVGNATRLPITVDRELLEGEEATITIPVTLR